MTCKFPTNTYAPSSRQLSEAIIKQTEKPRRKQGTMRRAWAYLAGSGGDAGNEDASAIDKESHVSAGEQQETNAGDQQQKQHNQGPSDDGDGPLEEARSSAGGTDGNGNDAQPDDLKTRATDSVAAGVPPGGDDGADAAAAVKESPESVSSASKSVTNNARANEDDNNVGAMDTNKEEQQQTELKSDSTPAVAPAPSSGLGLGLASAAALQLVANAETPQRAERIVDVGAATPAALHYEEPPATDQSSLLEQSWDPMASTSTEEETADIYDDDDEAGDNDNDGNVGNGADMEGAIATTSTSIGPSPPQSNGAISFGEPPTPIVGNRSNRNNQEGDDGKFVAENKEDEDVLVGSDLSIPVIVDPNGAPPASNGSSIKSSGGGKKGWSFFGMLQSAEEGAGGADGEISVLADVKSVVEGEEKKKGHDSGDGSKDVGVQLAHIGDEGGKTGAVPKAPEQQQAPEEASPLPVEPKPNAVVDAIPPDIGTGNGTDDDYASEVDLDEFDGSIDRNDERDNASTLSHTPPPTSPKRQEMTNKLLANLMADVADDEDGDGSIVPIKVVQPPSKGDGEECNVDQQDQGDDVAVAEEEVEISSTGVLEVDADEVFGLHESLNESKRNLVASGADEKTGGTASTGGQGPSADVDTDENDYGDDFEGVENELLESF